MVELADTQVLGACTRVYGFESHYPHHLNLSVFAADYIKAVDTLVFY